MPLTTRSLVLLLISSLALGCGVPQPDAAADPDQVVSSTTSSGALPSIAVAVIKDGAVVYKKASGVRKQGDPTPVELGDAYHIGSNTKAMTSMLVATFVDQGLLRWNSTLDELLRGVVEYRSEYAAVTLEQLLSHSSGLTDDTLVNVANLHSYFESTAPVTEARQRASAAALAVAPKSAPGTAYEYANVNYVVAAAALEHLTGKTWETLIRERLFTPLGMTSAGFGVPGTPGKVDAPWGHAQAPVEPGPTSDLPPVIAPAGCVHANLDDLIRYLTVYFEHGKLPGGAALVSESALAELERPRLAVPGTSASYALGWGVATKPHGTTLAHSGSNLRFLAYFYVVPSTRSALIFLTNRGEADAEAHVAALSRYFVAHFDL